MEEDNYSRRQFLEKVVQRATIITLGLGSLAYYSTRKRQEEKKDYLTKTWNVGKGKLVTGIPRECLETLCTKNAQTNEEIITWCKKDHLYLDTLATTILNHESGRKNYQKIIAFMKKNITLQENDSSQIKHPLQTMLDQQGNAND